MTISESLVPLVLNLCLLAIVAVDSQETSKNYYYFLIQFHPIILCSLTGCSAIFNKEIRQSLTTSIIGLSQKLCSPVDKDRTCECGSIQLLQDSVNHTLNVDLRCSCAFSKPVNCTQLECSSKETSPPTDAAGE